MTITEAVAFLHKHDHYLILTHCRPDGDTIGCAAALCALLRSIGKDAALYPNEEITARYANYAAPYIALSSMPCSTIITVDIAARELFPKNAESLRDRVDLAIDHHPSYEGFAKYACVDASRASCGEIICEMAIVMEKLTPEVALPLYVAVSTDTGCFVYSNTTAHTHRIAALLMDCGIDYRRINKELFRTKSKKRLALEAALLRDMKYFDDGRITVVALPRSLKEELGLDEGDTDDIASLGGLVAGCDCSVTMREAQKGQWKISLRTGDRINANDVCALLGGGGHRAAAGCIVKGKQEKVEEKVLRAIAQVAGQGDDNA